MMSYSEDVKEILEKQYSPSLWSKRFPSRDQVLQHHAQYVTAESEVAMMQVPHELDVPYGSSANQKVDIFGTDLPDDAPILVYVHGGYWQELSRQQSRYPVVPLHKAKIKTIVVGYDLCPSVTMTEIVHQITKAARFVFDYAENLKSKGVYFAGHSAGAHLIASFLSNEDFIKYTPGAFRLKGAFFISGIYDLRDLLNTTVNDALNLNYEEAIMLSPFLKNFYHLRDRKARLYVIAGQNDSTAFKKQSRDFYELLVNSCLVQNLYFEIKDDYDHFDIVESFALSDNFLKNLLVHDVRKYLD